jgi:cytochrome bd-type quinol oxidase subunit 2
MKKISYLVTKICIGLFLALSQIVQKTHAQGGFADFPGRGTLNITIQNILNLVFGLAGAIFVIMIIVGGLQYLTSAGNEEAAGKAKKLMTYAVIGIVIIAAAWAIADVILGLIGGKAEWPM